MNLSCSACAQSASDRCSMIPPGAEPALLTRMSTRPSARWLCSTKFLASASLVRSAGTGTILRPVSLAISDAAASSLSLRRAQIATSTPSRANARAMPLPMPSLPPVTSAALPLSCRSIGVSSALRSNHPGLGRGSDRLDRHVASVEEGQDPARTAFQPLVAPGERADQAEPAEHELDVAADVLQIG